MKTLVLLFALAPALALAAPWWLKGSNFKADDFLEPDLAFKTSAWADGNLIHLNWVIADGYYLYRSKFRIEAESPDLTIEPPLFPAGTRKIDPNLGAQEIYTRSVDAVVRYRRQDAGAHPLQVRITYQGCAEAGLCYPPIVKVLFPGSAPISGGAIQGQAQILASANATLPAALASSSANLGPSQTPDSTMPSSTLAPTAGNHSWTPDSVSRLAHSGQNSWVPLAIGAGTLAFLLAGFVLRRGRRLDFPAQ